MKNVRILLFLLLLSPLALGQSTTGLMPVIHQQFLDNLGTPLAGGFVYTYLSGTSTQHSSFKDSIGTLNTNPVVLDSGGYADIWLDNTAYRICVYTPSNVQQYCKDNITAAPATLGLTYAQLSGGNVFLGGAQIVGPQGTATVSNNFSSHTLRVRGSFWNGSAAANDDWQMQDVLGTGANPTSIFTLTHTGSSGAASFDLSSLGTSKLPSVDLTGKTATAGTFANPTVNTPTFSHMCNNGNAGCQIVGFPGCTTGATQYNNCSVVLTWATPFADTSYLASCTPTGVVGPGVFLWQGIVTKTAASVTAQIATGSNATVGATNIECLAIHN